MTKKMKNNARRRLSPRKGRSRVYFSNHSGGNAKKKHKKSSKAKAGQELWSDIAKKHLFSLPSITVTDPKRRSGKKRRSNRH